jgi:hypothetical protein
MMKKFWGWIISAAIWMGLFLLAAFVSKLLPGGSELVPVWFGACWALWVFGLVYPNLRVRNLLKSIGGRIFIIFGLMFVGFFGAYAYYLVTRSMRLYDVLTDDRPLFKGERLRKSDLNYGYRHLPNVEAIDLKMPGDTIYVYTDRDGFRVAADDTARSNDSGQIDVLFLGCSFTYGEMCEADSIFVDRTARSANLRCINAGVSGWGLSQMSLAAAELIPRYKPKHVVFQYSYWLPQRGISRYKSSMDFPLPNPHFVSDNNASFKLRLPGYASELFDGDRNIIQAEYAGAPLRFIVEEGLGIFLREDWYRMRDRIAMWKRDGQMVPQHEQSMTALCLQVYNDMMTLARNNGAIPHLLYLSEWSRPPLPMDSAFLSRYNDATVMNAKRYHDQYLNEHPELSRKWAFVHWRQENGDTIRVDGHPNAISHRLITRSILDGLGYLKAEIR